ncbi:MAG TPA: shikimate kinase [Stellaceae bacterium]|nr:shikimate kinase [Stellaceae bacterium]
MLDRTVVLVGLMGAGKTSIGQRLARRLGLGFVDADHEIETAANCTISEIFARHGEAAFRTGERRVIARLLEAPPHVLATGGGAFMDPSTRERIRARGISVWLRADLDTLVARVGRRGNRPLLAGDDPRAVLERLIAIRHPIYAEADIIVDSQPGAPDVLIDTLIRLLPTAGRSGGQL